MKMLKSMLPWMLFTVLTAGAIGGLLYQQMVVGRWLLAAFLLGHGVVHLLFAAPVPHAKETELEWPFDMSHTWLVDALGSAPHVVRHIGWSLIAMLVIGFALAALSSIGILVPAAWWPKLVAVSALTSILVLVVFFSPQLVLGVGINVALLSLVVANAWTP